MYRIRFHGRGGEGMKTASRILGTAFFLQGYEVQDAQRYGAERRGAPVFAYVRASKKAINERGIIHAPDLVVVADDSLFEVAGALLLEGVTEQTVILVNTAASAGTIQDSINAGKVITIRQPSTGEAAASTICAAASSRLAGVISRANLEQAIRAELSPMDGTSMESNVRAGLEVYDGMGRFAGQAVESQDVRGDGLAGAGWIDLQLHDTYRSAPAIHRSRTSALNHTGSWRTSRPEIDYSLCSGCMLCALYCPDSVISTGPDGLPLIGYEHCKGCMICRYACPRNAINKVPEHKTP